MTETSLHSLAGSGVLGVQLRNLHPFSLLMVAYPDLNMYREDFASIVWKD
jgi:hypothetical protein